MAQKIKTKSRLTPDELSGFCTQVAMMLESGIPMYVGMEALAQTQQGANKELYQRLSEQVVQTGTLCEAMRKTEGWPAYLVEMVGIGERTGKLDAVMTDLAGYYQRESRMRQAIRSAVTYPVVLGVMMVLIILVMLVKVLPVFRSVMANLGVSMTDSGNMMMRMGLYIGWVVLAIVGLLVLAIVVCCVLMRTPLRPKLLKTVNRLFPPLRHITLRLSSARVASVLSMMLSGGFPLQEALDMVPNVLDDSLARSQISKVRERVEAGDALGDALTQTGLFDEMSNCIIRTGCTVGKADQAMGRVAREYEQRAEESIDQLVSILEPTLVGVLAVVIGAILLSVMLPMAGIITSIL